MTEHMNIPTHDLNILVRYNVRVTHELVNKPSDIAKPWIKDGGVDDRRMISNQDIAPSKRICYPDEVNAIQLVSPAFIITHTESSKLFITDM